MTGEASEPAVVKFRDDEDGYLGWVRRNCNNGWVINVGRHFARSDGLVLHHAACDTISELGVPYTSSDRIKVCSTNREALVEWARREADADPSTECSCLLPEGGRMTMTGDASEPDIKKFRDDEDGYLDWVRRNSDGWVINAGRHFAPSDGLMLHSAICYHITKRGNHTTTGYIKVCSTDREYLVARVRRKAGAEPRPCRICVR